MNENLEKGVHPMAGGYAGDADIMDKGAQDVYSTNDDIQNQLSTLRSQLSNLEGAWEGTAATAFRQLMERFDNDAQKLNQALREIGEQMAQSSATYVEQEETANSAFGNIAGGLSG